MKWGKSVFNRVLGGKKVFLQGFFNGVVVIILFFMASVVLFFMCNVYYVVVGTSMEPNIREKSSSYSGDGCYVEVFSRYTYGDVVVASSFNAKHVVKRVVALGGDKIGYYYNAESGIYELILVQNNIAKKIDESYIVEKISDDEKLAVLRKNITSYYNFINNVAPLEDFEFEGQVVKCFEVKTGEVFLLGDNRQTSIDSSTYGAFKTSSVLGKVSVVAERSDIHVLAILKYLFF